MHYLKNLYKQMCYTEYNDELNFNELPVFYWHQELNLGDLYNNDVLKFIFPNRKKKLVKNNFNRRYLACVGSILQLTGRNATIMGSGFISNKSRLLKRPENLVAVRGKLTADKLKSRYGIHIDVFGDMGLIANRIFDNLPKEHRYKYGIIPHFKDFDAVNTSEFQSDDVLIIDIRTENTREFLEKLNCCEFILSSSLHGLIFADSFGIPNQRLVLGNRIIGGDFKFKDYFSSVDRELDEEYLRPLTVADIKNRARFFNGTVNQNMLSDTINKVHALF